MPTLPSYVYIQEHRDAEISRRVQGGLTSALFQGRFAIAEGLAEALDEATSRTSQKVIAFGEVLAEGPTAGRRREAHQQLGEIMHAAVLTSYRRHTRRPGNALYGPQRFNREAHGALDRALADPGNIFKATAEGVEFVNAVGLTRDAKQWARLNYGAGARGRGALAPFEVRFSNLVLDAVGLEEGPRPAFGIPNGRWLDAEGNRVGGDASSRGAHAFFPGGNKGARGIAGAKRTTKGITGWNFLDAGVTAFALEFSGVYRELFRDLVDKSIQRGRNFAIRPDPFSTRFTKFR